MCIKKLAVIFAVLFFTAMNVSAKEVWVNNLRKNFLENATVIYAINIRTFNAEDKNGNGIIDFDEGETSGNFVNAVSRLDELQKMGINVIHVLPITPVGKKKALGTAGSLYAAASFNSLNPQLKDITMGLSLEEQAKKFVEIAHNKGISVIVDLPSCGSYDLFLQRPELFVKDTSGQPIIPSDWTDVRLLNAGTETNINKEVLTLYKDFVDYMMHIGFDGIRADVAHSKPAAFWKELIDYSRKQDPQFLWLAESSDSWHDAVSDKAVFTPYDKLLQAGFDGYYGSFFNLKDWKTSKDLQNQVNLNLSLKKTIGDKKSVIGSFATHDTLSPILEHGPAFSRMIMWLNATLPINAYFVDGFDTGDKYIYMWANKKAPETYTDDDIYFVHRGKIDIFNFSRKPGGNNSLLKEEFVKAAQMKRLAATIYNEGVFKFLRTTKDTVFAYMMSNADETVIVIGNLNFKAPEKVKITVPKLKQDTGVLPITLQNIPSIENGAISTNLEAGEIQVLIINNVLVQ